jgi:hypothetical protein
MKKVLFILLGLMIFAFAGCARQFSVNANITGDEKAAEEVVKAQGYKITAYKGEVNKYILEKSNLYGSTETLPYQQSWGVQQVEPDRYFGKEIVIYGFTVKNHPLQQRDKNAKDGVNLYIMLSEGKVVGGYSYPNANVSGAYSSMDGKTLEEVTGLSFQQWQDTWKDKYAKGESSNIVASMTDELFDLKLYVDKDKYTDDEVINSYATLEYIGQEDSITVYSGDPLVGFALKDDKYFDGGYFTNDVLLTTTIKKGEVLRFDYVKSGGWTGEDPNASFYQKFYSDKALILPTGTYEISAAIACSLDRDDFLGSEYNKSVSANIKVLSNRLGFIQIQN